MDLFKTYVIDEALSKKILMSLTADDFCEALQNEYEGFESEELYVFAKEVTLLQRFGTEEEKVIHCHVHFENRKKESDYDERKKY